MEIGRGGVFEKDIPLYTAFELYIEQLKGNVYMYTHTHLNMCTCVYINVHTYTLCTHIMYVHCIHIHSYAQEICRFIIPYTSIQNIKVVN